MTNTIKAGDRVRRKKPFRDTYLWTHGDSLVTVTNVQTCASGYVDLAIEGSVQRWSADRFEKVTFVKGDRVRRKVEFLNEFEWSYAQDPVVVEDGYPGSIRLEGDHRVYMADRFELVNEPSYFVRCEIDRATKPLHVQIEALDLNARTLKAIVEEKVRVIGLRDARIRVLEGDIDHCARYQKVIDEGATKNFDLARQISELEVGIAAVRLGKNYDLRRIQVDLDRVTQDRDYWKRKAEEGSDKMLCARITILEHALDDAKRAIRTLNAMTNAAVRSFNV